jgi:replicative DNA helicase
LDIQHALLSKAVLDADLVPLVDARITPAFFTDDTYRRVYEYLLQHWRDYGTSPDVEVVKRAFPGQRWLVYEQPIEYFIDQMRQRRKRTILTEGLSEAAGHMQASDEPDSVDLIEAALQKALTRARLEVSATFDTDFTQSADAVDKMLTERAENPGHLRGISTGFHGIDYVTGGYQPEQLITIIGTPKSFKSSTLLYSAWQCHRQGHVPLFLGFEMSNSEQQDRLLSLLSGISLTRIMNGEYTEIERKAIVRAVKLRESMRPFILSSDITSATTVAGVQAKIQEYNPDVVFIDGAYLMDADNPDLMRGSPQALTETTRSLKRLGQRQRIAIVITTQALLARSGKGLTMASPGYSSSFAQDSDVLLGTERDGDQDDSKAEVRVKFHVIASRSGPRRETFLEWDWSKGSVIEIDPAQFTKSALRKAEYDDDED